MSIDAMKQVLAAWESGDLRNLGACIPALRAAIEQEPVSLNEGLLTRYADGSIGVGTPENPEQAEGGHLGIGDGTLMLDGQYPHSKDWQGLTVWCGCGDGIMPNSGAKCGNCLAADSASRQWQGLTRQEFLDATQGLEDLEDCWIAIEAKLRSKNNVLP